MYQVLNQEVDILSFVFTNGRKSQCIPKRIEFGGTQLEFIETGLRCLVKKGQEIVEIFTLSDGRHQYRLKFEPNNRMWTILTKQSLR